MTKDRSMPAYELRVVEAHLLPRFSSNHSRGAYLKRSNGLPATLRRAYAQVYVHTHDSSTAISKLTSRSRVPIARLDGLPVVSKIPAQLERISLSAPLASSGDVITAVDHMIGFRGRGNDSEPVHAAVVEGGERERRRRLSTTPPPLNHNGIGTR